MVSSNIKVTLGNDSRLPTATPVEGRMPRTRRQDRMGWIVPKGRGKINPFGRCLSWGAVGGMIQRRRCCDRSSDG